MKRLNLNEVPDDVQRSFRSLPTNAEGLELKLDGIIICEVFPPRTSFESERATLIARGRNLAKRSRDRNARVPTRVIEREIQQAIDEVRRRKNNDGSDARHQSRRSRLIGSSRVPAP